MKNINPGTNNLFPIKIPKERKADVNENAFMEVDQESQ